MDENDESRPLPQTKPSTIPSWVMLGFLLGVSFMWLLPRPTPPAKVIPAVEPRPELKAPAAPRFTAIEAVFTEWGQAAVWGNDLAEVALWNPESQNYTDFFEVLRTEKGYYFRSLSRLTRPVINRGMKSNSPLLFTETESHRQEWLKQVADENARTLSNAARQIFGPAQKPEVVPPPTPGLSPAASQIAPK